MDSENHVCIWCKSPTKKVISSFGENNFRMVCDECGVDYKFRRGVPFGFSVRRRYNGDDYVYRLVCRFVNLMPKSFLILSRCNNQAKDPLEYYEDICEIDKGLFSPERALGDIPKHLSRNDI